MVYIFTGKQHRMRQNNDIYITSEMALVFMIPCHSHMKTKQNNKQTKQNKTKQKTKNNKQKKQNKTKKQQQKTF